MLNTNINEWDLIDRFDIKNDSSENVRVPGIWFYLKLDNKTYSVMNIGRLLKSHAGEYTEGMFSGWEAWDLESDNSDHIMRFETLKNLLKYFNIIS